MKMIEYFYTKVNDNFFWRIIMALHVMDEANRCLQCKVPQCQKGCPIGTNIPVAIRLLKENKLDEAARKNMERWLSEAEKEAFRVADI